MPKICLSVIFSFWVFVIWFWNVHVSSNEEDENSLYFICSAKSMKIHGGLSLNMLYWIEFGILILQGEFVSCFMKWDFIWVNCEVWNDWSGCCLNVFNIVIKVIK